MHPVIHLLKAAMIERFENEGATILEVRVYHHAQRTQDSFRNGTIQIFIQPKKF